MRCAPEESCDDLRFRFILHHLEESLVGAVGDDDEEDWEQTLHVGSCDPQVGSCDHGNDDQIQLDHKGEELNVNVGNLAVEVGEDGRSRGTDVVCA